MAAYTLSQLRDQAPAEFQGLDDEDLVREYARIKQIPFEQAADYYGVKARGTLGEMGRQAAGGAMVDLPRMVGQGLKATGFAPELGQRMVEGSEERAYQYEMDRRPERGLVGQALTLGARGLAPTVPIIASAFVPGGQVVAPAMAVGLFGTSSYQETYEKLIDQGVSEKEARAAALKVGALQGGGEGVATAAFGALAKPVLGAMRGAPTTAGVAQAATQTGIVRPIVRGQAINIPVQAGTEALQDVGTELIERDAGAAPEDIGEIAKQSALGGAGLALLLGLPLGVGGSVSRSRQAEQLQQALYGEDTPAETRMLARRQVARLAREQGVPAAETDAWIERQLREDQAVIASVKEQEDALTQEFEALAQQEPAYADIAYALASPELADVISDADRTNLFRIAEQLRDPETDAETQASLIDESNQLLAAYYAAQDAESEVDMTAPRLGPNGPALLRPSPQDVARIGPPITPGQRVMAGMPALNETIDLIQSGQIAEQGLPVTGELTPGQQAALAGPTPIGDRLPPSLRGVSLDLDTPTPSPAVVSEVPGIDVPGVSPAAAPAVAGISATQQGTQRGTTTPQAQQTETQGSQQSTAVDTDDVTAEQEAEIQSAIDELGLRPLTGGAKENLDASVQGGNIKVGGTVSLPARTIAATANNFLTGRKGTGASGKLAAAMKKFSDAYRAYLDAAGNMVPSERKDKEGNVTPLKPMRGSTARGTEAVAAERAAQSVAKVRALWKAAQSALGELGVAADNNAKNVEAMVKVVKGRIAAEKARLQGELETTEDTAAIDAQIRELEKLDIGLSRGWAAAKRGNLRNDTDMLDVRGGETRTSTEEQKKGATQPLVAAANEGARVGPRAPLQTGFQGVLNYIRSNGSPFERMIAKAISEVFKNTKSQPKIVFAEGMPQYDPRTNTITMSPTASTEVALHEGLHAALQWYVHTNPKSPYVVQLLRAVDKVVKFDTKQLSPKAAAVQKVLADLVKGKRELDAVLELVSYGNTLVEFRKALEAMPTDAAPSAFVQAASDVWNMILATVRRMLGVPQSVASDVIMDSFKLLSEASGAKFAKTRKGGTLDAAIGSPLQAAVRSDAQTVPVLPDTPMVDIAKVVAEQTNAQAAREANYPSLVAYRSTPGSSLNLTRLLFERIGFGADGAATKAVYSTASKAADIIRSDFPTVEKVILNINSRFGLPPGMARIIEYFKSHQNTGILEMEKLTEAMHQDSKLSTPILKYLDGDMNAFDGVKDASALKLIADNVRYHLETYINSLPEGSNQRALFSNLKFSEYLLNPQSFSQLANKSFGLQALPKLLELKRRNEESLDAFEAFLPMTDGVVDSSAPLYQTFETITNSKGETQRVPMGFISKAMADGSPPAGMDIDRDRIWKFNGMAGKKFSFVSRATSAADIRKLAEEGKVQQLSAALLNTMAALSHNYASRNYFRGLTQLGRTPEGKPTAQAVVFDSIDDINAVFKGRQLTKGSVLNASADEAKNKEIRGAAQRTGVWVKLPPGDKYGDLAGKYVSGPVWSSMLDMHDRSPLFNSNALLQTMTWFKKAKTVYTPATHVNNILTNYALMFLHGISHKNLRDAASLFARFETNPDKMSAKDRAIVQAFYRSGAVLGQYTQTEAKQTIAAALVNSISPDASGSMLTRMAELAKFEKSFADNIQKAAQKGRNFDARAMELYAAGDNIFRLAAFMNTAGNLQTRDNTATLTDAQLQEAGIAARKVFLDYDIDSRWVRAARQSFLPFVSWSYAIMPVLGRIAVEKPWAMVNMMGAIALASAVFDGDDDEWRKTGPEMVREKSFWGLGPHMFMRVPFLGDDENPVFYNIGKSIPMMALADPPASESKLFGQSWVPGFITPGGPYVNLIAGLFLGIDPFTGKALSDETDTQLNKLLKAGESVYNTMTPSFAQTRFMGSIAGLAEGKVGPTGVDANALFLARTLGGMSLYEFNRQETDFYNDKEVQKMKREFGAAMAKAKRDEYNKGYPDYEALDVELAKLRGRLEKRIAEIRGEE
jgi:hypothetical protein